MIRNLSGSAPLAMLAWGGGVFALDPFALRTTVGTLEALGTLALVLGPSLLVMMLASRSGVAK